MTIRGAQFRKFSFIVNRDVVALHRELVSVVLLIYPTLRLIRFFESELICMKLPAWTALFIGVQQLTCSTRRWPCP